MLIIQAGADRIAPKEDASDILLGAYGRRVEVIVVDRAGHALLPEQLAAVEKAVLQFLQLIAPSSSD